MLLLGKIALDIPTAKIGQQTFPFSVRTLASGSFSGLANLAGLGDDGAVHLLENAHAVAHLAKLAGNPAVMRIAGKGKAAAVSAVGGRQTRRQALVQLAAQRKAALKSILAAVLPMRLNQHPLQGLVLLSSGQAAPIVAQSMAAITQVVTNTSDSGAGSLRDALTYINNDCPAPPSQSSSSPAPRPIPPDSARGRPISARPRSPRHPLAAPRSATPSAPPRPMSA
jgi:hypothetical protein